MPIIAWEFLGAGLLITAGAVLANAFWRERFFFETNKFYHGQATGNSKNITILQISDLHLQSINSLIIRLTNKINQLEPDLVVITGDALDNAKNIYLLDEFLKLIDNNIQKVAILGNWEYQAKIDLAELEKIYSDNNCRLLINQTAQYLFQQKTISITGVDDYLRGNADIDTATKAYKKSDYHIILAHCPQYTDNILKQISKNINVDFVLSGHTHGGQVNLFGFIHYLPNGSGRYVKGWYNNGLKLYVSKGIGTVFLPVRFGARAEIAIFNLAT